MFKEYMEKIYDRFGTENTMYDTIDIVSDMVEEIKHISPETYDRLLCRLEEYLYVIPIEEAKEIVANMSNGYGMSGGRWTYEQTTEVAEKYQLPESINRCDFYIVMNMWDMDYRKTMEHLRLKDSLDAYVRFSCDWLTDSDFGEGKVYKYFVKIHEEDEEEGEDE